MGNQIKSEFKGRHILKVLKTIKTFTQMTNGFGVLGNLRSKALNQSDIQFIRFATIIFNDIMIC